jgi:hypothetical protein
MKPAPVKFEYAIPNLGGPRIATNIAELPELVKTTAVLAYKRNGAPSTGLCGGVRGGISDTCVMNECSLADSER